MRGGAYGKAGGQNPQVPEWSALNTQKVIWRQEKFQERVRGTLRPGLPALGPGQEAAPEALPEPAVFSVPALQLLKLLGGQHHPTVRLAVLRRETMPRLRVGCRQPPSDLPHRCPDTHPVCGRPEAVGQGHTPLPQRETPRLAGPRPVIQEGGKTETPLLGDAEGGHTPAQETAEQEHREKQGKSRESPTGHSGGKGSSDASKVWWGYVTISVTWSGLDFCGGGLNHTLAKDGEPSPCIFV